MKSKILSVLSVLLMLPALSMAQDVLVTRGFTGLWDQIEHENQGINLQIVEQPNGKKEAVAYWFTYGDDMTSAWFIGIGSISGNRIEMKLYEVSGVGFLEDDSQEKNEVEDIGEMEIEFSSCDEGEVKFSSDNPGVGSGVFPIVRLTNMINTRCSGGISDDTPSDVLISEQRISLAPARTGTNGSGHADFEERPDRTEFSVEVEDIPDGNYRIFVGGVDRGELMVALGTGETEYRSPVESGKVLLTFDPRGEIVEVRDSQGAILTSGDSVFPGGDDDDGDDDNGGGDDDGDDDNGGGDDDGDDDNGGGDDDGDDDNGGGDDDGDDDNGGGDDDDNGGGDDDGDDDNGGGDSGNIDFGSSEIKVDLTNTGVFPAASGDANLRPRSDRTDFSIEIEDLPVGSYDVIIGSEFVGTIPVTMMQDGSVEGELEFRDPVEPGKQLLNFDPRGKQIDIKAGTSVVLETQFPAN